MANRRVVFVQHGDGQRCQGDHCVYTQSTGQGKWLQFTVSRLRPLHSWPWPTGPSLPRVRTFKPTPQLLLHASQPCHWCQMQSFDASVFPEARTGSRASLLVAPVSNNCPRGATTSAPSVVAAGSGDGGTAKVGASASRRMMPPGRLGTASAGLAERSSDIRPSLRLEFASSPDAADTRTMAAHNARAPGSWKPRPSGRHRSGSGDGDAMLTQRRGHDGHGGNRNRRGRCLTRYHVKHGRNLIRAMGAKDLDLCPSTASAERKEWRKWLASD
mmetsp:Transcript_113826/g.321924  ORF Transcript_113826/g.321924 Transcript_113826/m.321924 type:complete len:272 (-) Transcript_113826:6-821(-)